ncbi:MAG: glycosyltransferase [bacterium]
MNILFVYSADLYTTANYCVKPLKKSHTVITCGQGKDGKVQDIPCQFNSNISDVIDKIDEAKKPQLIIYTEGCPPFFPKGLDKVQIPTVWYPGDPIYNFHWQKEIAPIFDFLFIYQKELVDKYKELGNNNVYWLPYGCDLDIHKKYEGKKIYDVCFIGNTEISLHPERVEFLNRLSRRFNVYIDKKFLDEMAQAFSQAKIVFNKSTKNDLNMRVFEALSCGSFLITDRLFNNGLEDLFVDKKHLVIYDNYEHLEGLVDYYLKHPEEREEIARQGREEALKKHTYEHRMNQLIQIVTDALNSGYKKKEINYSPFVRSIIYADVYFNLKNYPEAILEYKNSLPFEPVRLTPLFRLCISLWNSQFYLAIGLFKLTRFLKRVYLKWGKMAITNFTLLRKVYLNFQLRK